MKVNRVVKEFADFYWVARDLPGFTLKEQEKSWQLQGLIVEQLLNGGTKEQFLIEGKRIDEMFQIRRRFFYMLYPEELEACLFWVTKDERYAQEQREHELEHYQLFLNFQSSNGDRSPKSVFAILVLSGGGITPYTSICSRVFPYTIWPMTLSQEGLVISIRKDPYALLKEWSVETIREFWWYLRENVTNGSKGDQLILRN